MKKKRNQLLGESTLSLILELLKETNSGERLWLFSCGIDPTSPRNPPVKSLGIA